MTDWIDEEAMRRRHGETRPLLQSQHAEVNSRYPGCTLEYCAECGRPTGRAGRKEDSIYCEDRAEAGCEAGPLCRKCWCQHEHNPEKDEHTD